MLPRRQARASRQDSRATFTRPRTRASVQSVCLGGAPTVTLARHDVQEDQLSAVSSRPQVSERRFIPYLSSAHNEVLNIASRHAAAPGTEEWSVADVVRWKLGWKDIFAHKGQWVRGYRDAIKAAAERYDLPPELVAGVAYTEVAGDPPFFTDSLPYALRDEQGRNIPGSDKYLNPPRNKTSFGEVSIQIRRAAEALGYDSQNLSDSQRRAIIASLKIPQVNIFIVAKHLSDLRNIDYKGVSGSKLSREQVEVIGARYFQGPDLSLSNIQRDTGYGRKITKRWGLLNKLIR